MRAQQKRKTPRFFIVNPLSDRRREARFESRESVVIRVQNTGKTFPAIAYDIGHKGIKLESKDLLKPDMTLQVAFPNSVDHVRCFGKTVWSKSLGKTHDFETGVVVEGWFGIVEGGASWQHYKGFKPKRDRRNKLR